MDYMVNKNARGALHIAALFVIALIAATVFVVSSSGKEVDTLRAEVHDLNQRIGILEAKVQALSK